MDVPRARQQTPTTMSMPCATPTGRGLCHTDDELGRLSTAAFGGRRNAQWQGGDGGSNEEGTGGVNTEERAYEEGHDEGGQHRGEHLL